MKHYEITYLPTADATTEQSEFVIGADEKVALKSFSIKQPDVPPELIRSVNLTTAEKSKAGKKRNRSRPDAKQKYGSSEATTSGRSYSEPESFVLGFCGIIIALAGMYFLFMDAGTQTEFGEVANLHKMFIGQTLMIIGAIFIAAQWRPR